MEPSVFDGIVAMCSSMHKTVSVKSAQYLDEMRRHNYVTPTSYLELINMIKMVLEMRQKAVSEKRKRLMNGLDKLNTTKSEVATLQQQLAEQQPVLEQTTIEVQAQQVQIAADKEEAQLVQKEAGEAQASANVIAAECAEIKESAEADLAKAPPLGTNPNPNPNPNPSPNPNPTPSPNPSPNPNPNPTPAPDPTPSSRATRR